MCSPLGDLYGIDNPHHRLLATTTTDGSEVTIVYQLRHFHIIVPGHLGQELGYKGSYVHITIIQSLGTCFHLDLFKIKLNFQINISMVLLIRVSFKNDKTIF